MTLTKAERQYLIYVLKTHEINPDLEEREYQGEIELKISIINKINNV